MKIKLSKSQWKFIGQQAGWMKFAQATLDLDELSEAWASHEDDIIVNDKGEAFHGGKLICTPNEDYGPDFKAIRKWMNQHNYFPNVWVENDHGNVSLYSIDEQGNATYHGGLV